MDTLHDRLAELADDAPTGGAPTAELWARGKRAQRLRAAALAATLVVVGVVGAGIGVRIADGDGDHVDPAPAPTDGISLPIAYPVGQELPNLGETPGPLMAIWLLPRVDGGPPEAVAMVAETGVFGTLPIVVSYNHDETAPQPGVALSPDGLRIAYESLVGGLVVRDLVTGESYEPAFEFEIREGYTWVDNTHLLGHVAGGSDVDGWVWEPGTAPKLINPQADELPSDALWFARGAAGPGTRDWWVAIPGGGPRSCSPPILENWSDRFEVPELCDVLGFIPGNILLGHGNSDRLSGDWNDPDDGNGTVVALVPVRSDDPGELRVVVAAGAPERVALAVDLIAEALEDAGGAS